MKLKADQLWDDSTKLLQHFPFNLFFCGTFCFCFLLPGGVSSVPLSCILVLPMQNANFRLAAQSVLRFVWAEIGGTRSKNVVKSRMCPSFEFGSYFWIACASPTSFKRKTRNEERRKIYPWAAISTYFWLRVIKHHYVALLKQKIKKDMGREHKRYIN